MRSPRQRISARPPTYPPTPRPLRRGLLFLEHLALPASGRAVPKGLRGAALSKLTFPAPFAVPNNFPLHACDKAAQRILPPVWCRRIPASQNAAQRILRGSKAKQESCGESPNEPDRLTNFNPMLLYNLHEVRRNEHFTLAFLFALWYCTTSKGVRFCEHPGHRSEGGEGSRNGTIPPLTSSQPNPMLLI